MSNAVNSSQIGGFYPRTLRPIYASVAVQKSASLMPRIRHADFEPKPHDINKFASVLSIPKFVDEGPQSDTNFGIRTLVDSLLSVWRNRQKLSENSQVLNKSGPAGHGEAQLQYLDGDFRVVSPGTYVRCAVTDVRIPLDELKYWSVDLQEAYALPSAVLQRHFPGALKG